MSNITHRNKEDIRSAVSLIIFIILFFVIFISCIYVNSIEEKIGQSSYPELYLKDLYYGYAYLITSIFILLTLIFFLFVRWIYRIRDIANNLDEMKKSLYDIRILLTSIEKSSFNNTKQNKSIEPDSDSKKT